MPFFPLGKLPGILNQANTLSAGALRSGTITTQELILAGGGLIRSSNFDPDSSGWAIFGDGSARFMGSLFVGGDLTLQGDGFIRTSLSGNRIEIRPSGTLRSSITFFTGADFSTSEPFIETEDQGSGVEALKLVGPVDAAATDIAGVLLRSDGTVVLGAADHVAIEIGATLGAGTEVARLDATGLVQTVPSIVYARDRNSSATAIGTGGTNVCEATLSIPATWNTYDIEVEWQCDVNDSSGGATSTASQITAEITLDGAGTVLDSQIMELMDLNYHDQHGFSGVSFVEGETTTGNRVVRLRLTRSAAFTVNSFRAVLIVRAIRTS